MMACSHPRQSSPLSHNGLYLLLDEQWSETLSLVELLREAARCGVTMFQYRCKNVPMDRAFAQAQALCRVAKDYSVCMIVNDRCDLALAAEADGVHLGQQDLPLAHARQLMGPDKFIGISTHRPEEVVSATEGKADYIGFGPVFSTDTKPHHEPVVGIDGIRKARALTDLPIFAIGGITPETVALLLHAGANGVAVASAVLNAPFPTVVMKQFVGALAQANRQAE